MIQGDYLKIPETGDRGTVFCPAISQNFTTLDEHNHNGINSDKIEAKSLSKASVTLASASWALDTNGDYKQTLTLPSGYEFDTAVFKFVINSGANLGKEVYPTIIKLSATTCDVFVMTNSFDLKVVIS